MFKDMEEAKDTIGFPHRCQLPPFKHQLTGIRALVTHPTFALFDEMGVGKTKQVIDAAQTLFSENIIERVIVVAPAPVRDVWFDKELGELKKHLWDDVHARITFFHSKNRTWEQGKNSKVLDWIITNYEFIRKSDRLNQLLPFATHKT